MSAACFTSMCLFFSVYSRVCVCVCALCVTYPFVFIHEVSRHPRRAKRNYCWLSSVISLCVSALSDHLPSSSCRLVKAWRIRKTSHDLCTYLTLSVCFLCSLSVPSTSGNRVVIWPFPVKTWSELSQWGVKWSLHYISVTSSSKMWSVSFLVGCFYFLFYSKLAILKTHLCKRPSNPFSLLNY